MEIYNKDPMDRIMASPELQEKLRVLLCGQAPSPAPEKPCCDEKHPCLTHKPHPGIIKP